MPVMLPRTVTYAPKVAETVAQEKAAEEAALRTQYQQQLKTLEAQARADFEAEMTTKMASARETFEAQLVKEKSKAQFEAELQTKTAQEKATFEASLQTQKTQIKKTYTARVAETRKRFRQALQIGIREAKRQAAMRQKTYAAVSPRMLRAYKKTEREMFEQAVTAEKEVFEEQAKAWEKRAVGTFETGLEEWKREEKEVYGVAVEEWEKEERVSLEKQLKTSEAEARAKLETEIKAWKITEEKKLEPQLEEWKEAWEPKGVAERILEWKPPDLPTFRVDLFQVPVEGGVVQVGFDVGKFSEGLMEGTAAATAGIVASAESLAYGVGGLVGLPTPRPPPTLIGGLISTAFVSVGAGELKPSPQLEELAAKPYAVTYAAATLLGDVMISLGIGKVAEKAVIQPLAKTRVGTYIGYQFKIHAPKIALRAVYGKKAAEYIVKERLPYTMGATRYISPTGQVVTQPYRIPKGVELTGEKYLKDVLTGTGVVETGVPWRVTRGARITPFKTTLSKAIQAGLKEKRGVTTLLAPLQTVEKVLRPELPELATALQFGWLPITETIPTITGLGAVLGVKLAAEVKVKALTAPAIKPVVRLKRKEKAVPIPVVGEILALAELQVPVELAVQEVSVAQKEALVQIQALKQTLKLEMRKPELKKLKIIKKKRKIEPWKKRGVLFEYPIRKEEEIPSFIFEGLGKTTTKKPKGMNLSNVIFGKRRRKK